MTHDWDQNHTVGQQPNGARPEQQSPPPVQEAYRREYFRPGQQAQGQNHTQQSSGQQAGANPGAYHTAGSQQNYSGSYQSSTGSQQSYSGGYQGYTGAYQQTQATAGASYKSASKEQRRQEQQQAKAARKQARAARKQERAARRRQGQSSGWTFGRSLAALSLAVLLVLGSGTAGSLITARMMQAQHGQTRGTGVQIHQNSSQDQETGGQTLQQSGGKSVVDIVKETSPAMVAINAEVVLQDIFGQQQRGVNSGSGVLINAEGYIVTNSHVIGSAQEVQVTLADGSEHKGQVVGRNQAQDIAVVKIEGKDFPYVKFGDSSQLQVGQSVLAIGNPLGELQGTVTSGIISALHRDLTVETGQLDDLIQTDVAINHGNSGGALLNDKGELIGINVARSESQNGQSAVIGISFAIPAEKVKAVVEALTDPKYEVPYIGISGQQIDQSLRQVYGLPEGVWVAKVEKNGPAEKAGLKVRDIILEFDGKAVKSISEIQSLLSLKKVGDVVELKLDRNGASQTLRITLEKRPA